ncbi:MAG TPA: thiamine pyrophosphate-dependent dehydrogenase E1 component subunit alpha [Longimicrobiales bacterium]
MIPSLPDGVPSGLGTSELLALFDGMVRVREAEERLEILFRQGHVGGGVYRALGQEAGPVGAAFALRRRSDGTGDVLAHTVRAAGAVFLFGGTPLEFFRQYMARATGPTRGREANVHWADFKRGLLGPVSPLGTMVEVMSGVTLSFRMRGEPRVGIVFYGDGASSTGAWHEGLGFAASQGCPLLLMVEANGYAFSTPTRMQTRVASFADKAPAYGVHGVSVDGNDVLDVYAAVRDAAARARDGGGPQLIELRTFRRKGHAQHDAQEYVDAAEILAWEGRDPIDRYRDRLTAGGWATTRELADRRDEIHHEIRAAAERAIDEPLPSGPEALLDVYTDFQVPAPWTRFPEPTPDQPSRLAVRGNDAVTPLHPMPGPLSP